MIIVDAGKVVVIVEADCVNVAVETIMEVDTMVVGCVVVAVVVCNFDR